MNGQNSCNRRYTLNWAITERKLSTPEISSILRSPPMTLSIENTRKMTLKHFLKHHYRLKKQDTENHGSWWLIPETTRKFPVFDR